MFCTVILWDLSMSEQTVESLRSYLRDYAVDAYAGVEGLRQKVWLSSSGPEGETWGAVYLWDDAESIYGRPPGVSRVMELIGYMPTQRSYFSVEAGSRGLAEGALAGLGLAFTGGPPLARPAEQPYQGP
jgi:hypothetical protein